MCRFLKDTNVLSFMGKFQNLINVAHGSFCFAEVGFPQEKRSIGLLDSAKDITALFIYRMDQFSRGQLCVPENPSTIFLKMLSAQRLAFSFLCFV